MLRRMLHTCPNKVFVFLNTPFIEEKQLEHNKRSHSTKGEIIIQTAIDDNQYRGLILDLADRPGVAVGRRTFPYGGERRAQFDNSRRQ